MVKLKAERDILKKAAAYFATTEVAGAGNENAFSKAEFRSNFRFERPVSALTAGDAAIFGAVRGKHGRLRSCWRTGRPANT
jgi:hypothetical protein